MEVLRTPDERFADLPGYPFEPHYVEIARRGSRVHYVDEGPTRRRGRADAPRRAVVVATSTGKMIPVFTAAGLRAVAPDLVGFGRSDKPTPRTDYTYQRHVDWTVGDVLERSASTTSRSSCQDWGGLIGLRLVAEHPDRFARVVVANGFLPTGDSPPSDAFLAWQKFSQEVPELPIGAHRQRRLRDRPARRGDRRLRRAVPRRDLQGRGAPVPAARADLAATTPPPPANRAAWEVAGKRSSKPVLTAFSDSDPITARRRPRHPEAASRAPRASRTPRSRAAATSSRRTRARSWPRVDGRLHPSIRLRGKPVGRRPHHGDDAGRRRADPPRSRAGPAGQHGAGGPPSGGSRPPSGSPPARRAPPDTFGAHRRAGHAHLWRGARPHQPAGQRAGASGA